MNKKRFTFILVNFAVIFICFPAQAFAYLDPGTGSLLLQLLGMAFVAMGGVWVVFKSKVAKIFGRGKDKDKDKEEDKKKKKTVKNLESNNPKKDNKEE